VPNLGYYRNTPRRDVRALFFRPLEDSTVSEPSTLI
jgi:hypothetical protein